MRRLCRFTAGFSIGCAACVAHFRSGAYLLAAIAAALCVLALGFRKQLHLQRLFVYSVHILIRGERRRDA